jgi:hypothetical protein
MVQYLQPVKRRTRVKPVNTGIVAYRWMACILLPNIHTRQTGLIQARNVVPLARNAGSESADMVKSMSGNRDQRPDLECSQCAIS